MAKFFAVTIICNRDRVRDSHPATHLGCARGYLDSWQLIDEQMSETMAEAGISFLASQFVLAFFIWKYSRPPRATRSRDFPAALRVW